MCPSDENSHPGRKPAPDDAKRREIFAILAIGGTRTMAARYVGCSLDTIGRTDAWPRAAQKRASKSKIGARKT